jgi:hypothetical protein
VRSRLDIFQVELVDHGDVSQHSGELSRHRLELIFAQPKARQARHVQYLVAVDHDEAFYGALGPGPRLDV